EDPSGGGASKETRKHAQAQCAGEPCRPWIRTENEKEREGRGPELVTPQLCCRHVPTHPAADGAGRLESLTTTLPWVVVIPMLMLRSAAYGVLANLRRQLRPRWERFQEGQSHCDRALSAVGPPCGTRRVLEV